MILGGVNCLAGRARVEWGWQEHGLFVALFLFLVVVLLVFPFRLPGVFCTLCQTFQGFASLQKVGSCCWLLLSFYFAMVISAFAHIPTLRKGGPTSVFVLD